MIKKFLIYLGFICSFGFSSPNYAINYLDQDIINCKRENGKIFEVMIDSVRYIGNGIVIERVIKFWDKNQEILDTSIREKYLIKFKVISNILNHEYPKLYPLYLIDESRNSKHHWTSILKDNEFKEKKFIVLINSKRRLTWIYEETNRMSHEAISEAREKDILKTINSDEYKNYINYKNVRKILKNTKVIN